MLEELPDPRIIAQALDPDTRRTQPIAIAWDGAGVGRISIGGEYWTAVEWSEKRQAWCIEDAEGRCLAHKDSIHGQAASKQAAVALAHEMIRDGRMPSPQQAREAHIRRREIRRQRPAEQRRRAEREQRRQAESQASRARYETEFAEKSEQPLWEILHDSFDFADAELWKSNSFAALRPRLIVHLEAVVAKLRAEQVYEANQMATSSRRGKSWYQRQLAALEPKLAKAREVLLLLRRSP
jgi:hypothetical protein